MVKVSGSSPTTTSSVTSSRKEAVPRLCPAGMTTTRSSATGLPASSTMRKSTPFWAVSPGMVMATGTPLGPMMGCPSGSTILMTRAERPPKPRVKLVSTERAAPGPKEAVTVNRAVSSPSRTTPVKGGAAAAPEAPAGGAGATCKVTYEGGASLSATVTVVGMTANSLSGCLGNGRR